MKERLGLSEMRKQANRMNFAEVSDMSRLVGKLTMWFPNGSDTNRAIQAQKMARGLKFWI